MRTSHITGARATLLAAVLGACASPAQLAANKQQEMDRMIAVYGPACGKLGFATGSDGWRNCVVQLSIKDEAARYASYAYYYPPWWHGGAW